MQRYDKLKEFVEKNSRLPSSYSKNKEEESLGNWCQNHKSYYKRGKLSQERIKLLEEIPNWFWKQDEKWIQNCNNLKKFVEINNKLPSDHSKNKVEKSLGQWYRDQRKHYKKGKLSLDKIKLLESIPNWVWQLDLDEQWKKLCSDVNEFSKINNRLPSQYSKIKDEKTLGNWCAFQREKQKSGKLSLEQQRLSEEIPNWYWKRDLEENWKNSYDNLKKFAEINKRLPSSTSSENNEKTLGQWHCSQRHKYKIGELSQEQIKLSEKIPNWFWHLDEKWIKSYSNVKQFFELNNKLPSIVSINKSEKSLRIWCDGQRYNYKKGKLSQERIKLLKEIPTFLEKDR
jgi:hypothetical protein